MAELRKKDIGINFIYNLIASTLPIAVMQFITYPILSRNMSDEVYGLMINYYSIFILFSNAFGVVVSDLRLMYNKDYKDTGRVGDFNIILILFAIASTLCMIASIFYYRSTLNLADMIIILITSIIIFFTPYLNIGLIIHLQYKKVFFSSILMSLGYVIGLLLCLWTGYWEFIYLVAYLLYGIYSYRNTDLIKEPIRKTDHYPVLLKESWIMLVSSIFANAITYADKVVLYPLLGGTAVSIYYTASLLGKTISIAVTSINKILLGYLSNMNRMKNSIFIKYLFAGVVIHLIAYVICLLITKPLIGFLFPRWVDEVMIYVPITTGSAVLAAFSSMLQPFVLRYTPVKWQSFINVSSTIAYFICALFLLKYFGLIGFCWGGFIGCAYKVIVMIIIYLKCKRNEI